MHKVLTLLYLGLFTLLLNGCENAKEPPFRVGINTWSGYKPFYLARDLGYYDASAIKLVELTSASDVIYALRAGSLEAAALTLDEVLLLLSDGFKLQIILIVDYSNGADVLLAKPGFESMAELRGRRVAVENSAVGALLLDGALAFANMSATDITLVSCLADQHEACFNSTDAVVTYEPIKSKLIAKGAIQLFDSSQIPDRIIDVLVVRTDIVTKNPQSIKKLLRGYFLAFASMANEHESITPLPTGTATTANGDKMDEFSGIRQPTLSENKNLLRGNPPPFERQVTQLMDFMAQRKLLGGVIEIKDIATDKYLPVSNE